MASGTEIEEAPLIAKPRENPRHLKNFVRVMRLIGLSEEAAAQVSQRYQIETFLKGMLEVRAAMEAKRRLWTLRSSLSFPPEYGVEQMATFQQIPIGTSLLRIEGILEPYAVKTFQDILKYMGVEDEKFLTRKEEVPLVHRILNLLQRYPALRDEVCAQLIKQTVDNPILGSCLKAWELFRVIVASFPPSASFAGPLSEYFLSEIHDEEAPAVIHQAVLATWITLDKTLKIGPHSHTPTSEEIEMFLEAQPIPLVVYTYDDASKPLEYDLTTTVADVAKAMVSAIKLHSCNTFGLYLVRPIPWFGPKSPPIKGGIHEPEETLYEHVKLEGAQYMGDVLAESRVVSIKRGTAYSSFKFLLKKRIFRNADQQIKEPKFVQLCFAQAIQDYMTGYYPVTKKTAKDLSALQIIATVGSWQAGITDLKEVKEEVRSTLPKEQFVVRNIGEWEDMVLEAYKEMPHVSKEEARLRALHILLDVPNGGCVFFFLSRDVDPSSAFPEALMLLGVSNRGVRFLDAKSKDLIHVVDLKDIREYAANSEKLYLSMVIKKELGGFEFYTTEGNEICTLLDAHIEDAVRLMGGGSAPSTPLQVKVPPHKPGEKGNKRDPDSENQYVAYLSSPEQKGDPASPSGLATNPVMKAGNSMRTPTLADMRPPAYQRPRLIVGPERIPSGDSPDGIILASEKFVQRVPTTEELVKSYARRTLKTGQTGVLAINQPVGNSAVPSKGPQYQGQPKSLEAEKKNEPESEFSFQTGLQKVSGEEKKSESSASAAQTAPIGPQKKPVKTALPLPLPVPISVPAGGAQKDGQAGFFSKPKGKAPPPVNSNGNGSKGTVELEMTSKDAK